jgi:chromosome segregation ATPase
MRRRQEDRERVVCSLKHEIANYNDECLELKKANDELDYELQRVTQQLKDIIVHYEGEFSTFGQEKKRSQDIVRDLQATLKDQEAILNRLRQDIK